MPLSKLDLHAFKCEILRASRELDCDELHYVAEWVYDLPGQSLEINGIYLHEKYSIPIGWDGYGKDDLDSLILEGVLEQIYYESDKEILKEDIIYRIKHK